MILSDLLMDFLSSHWLYFLTLETTGTCTQSFTLKDVRDVMMIIYG